MALEGCEIDALVLCAYISGIKSVKMRGETQRLRYEVTFYNSDCLVLCVLHHQRQFYQLLSTVEDLKFSFTTLFVGNGCYKADA